ncbi:SCO0607 family lipoprotein [Streptomyces sp. NPDC052040]|uniref:SCO0607 family lipoprotein n=1 Tax=Streptomyces sp. NPDC052040 TaxID=3365682 RepID=UPI0037CFDB8D
MSNSRRISRPAVAFRPRGVRGATAALLGAAALAVLPGCSSLEYREGICRGSEYPVLTVNGTGSACVTNGEKPPAGYVRYPEGKVPQHVDDKWDVYWRTHTVDEHGTIVNAPDAG